MLGRGRYRVNLSPPERQLLRALRDELVLALEETGGPDRQPRPEELRRLFPPAYLAEDDQERQNDYASLMDGDLAASQLEALGTLERTADADEVGRDELDSWVRSLNFLRLTLGTRLDVSEEDDPFSATTPEQHLYYYLGYLQESVVEALASDLPS